MRRLMDDELKLFESCKIVYLTCMSICLRAFLVSYSTTGPFHLVFVSGLIEQRILLQNRNTWVKSLYENISCYYIMKEYASEDDYI